MGQIQSMVKHFKVYCLSEQIDELEFMPCGTSGDLFVKSQQTMRIMGGFITYLVEQRGVQPSTALKYQRCIMTELKAAVGFCLKLGHDWTWLTLLLNGLSKRFGKEKRRRDPLTPKILLKIKRTLHLGTHIGRSYWALILFLFYSVSRKGDNIPETADKFTAGHHIVKDDLSFETSAGVRFIVVRRTKDKTSSLNNGFGGKVLPEADAPLCAYSALVDMLEQDPCRLDPNRGQIPLFHTGDGTPITGPQLLKVLRGLLTAVGEIALNFGTHSLRIGGATLAMSCPGATEYTVKMLGYWAGKSVRLYTRPTREAMLDLGRKMMLTTSVNVSIHE